MRIKSFIRSNPVFVIAGAAALVSMLIVPPCPAYASYIDWRTIQLLCCQLLSVQGLMRSGVFSDISGLILKRASTSRSLCALLIFLCFFVSMLVTNDVSLISFVPLTILALSRTGISDLLIRTLVLETIAANLGSMFTLFGNPQNLYLFNLSGLSGLQFLILLAPYTLLSLALIAGSVFLIPARKLEMGAGAQKKAEEGRGSKSKRRRALRLASACLLTLCILVVFHLGNAFFLLILSAAVYAVLDRKVLTGVNYILPLTFIEFFILTGNIQALPGFSQTLSRIIGGRELVTAVLTSQVISNVPAAMLLSSFTGNIRALILGTDIGGLGTLIASMASLISFQFYGTSRDARPGKYLAVFTLYNGIFLAALLILAAAAGAL